MIYTITLNPAIDYIMRGNDLQLGQVNRLNHTQFLAGGKGINVSQILNQLDCANEAWGFLGGFTGTFVQDQLRQKHIHSAFTKIAQPSRINVKLKAKVETELNATGPKVSAAEIDQFKAQFQHLQPHDVVVMSGSLLPDLPTNFYQQLIELIQAHQAEFVVDTTGTALLDTLAAHPLVIKPNEHELADLFNTTFKKETALLQAAQKLRERGAQHVLVSMAGAGAYLLTKEGVYHAQAPKGNVVNSVGAGDSMIAGFVGKFTQTHDAKQAFAMGVACGSATAFTQDIANKAQIEALLPQIKITTVS